MQIPRSNALMQPNSSSSVKVVFNTLPGLSFQFGRLSIVEGDSGTVSWMNSKWDSTCSMLLLHPFVFIRHFWGKLSQYLSVRRRSHCRSKSRYSRAGKLRSKAPDARYQLLRNLGADEFFHAIGFAFKLLSFFFRQKRTAVNFTAEALNLRERS
jgi:hypothetical protein